MGAPHAIMTRRILGRRACGVRKRQGELRLEMSNHSEPCIFSDVGGYSIPDCKALSADWPIDSVE